MATGTATSAAGECVGCQLPSTHIAFDNFDPVCYEWSLRLVKTFSNRNRHQYQRQQIWYEYENISSKNERKQEKKNYLIAWRSPTSQNKHQTFFWFLIVAAVYGWLNKITSWRSANKWMKFFSYSFARHQTMNIKLWPRMERSKSHCRVQY